MVSNLATMVSDLPLLGNLLASQCSFVAELGTSHGGAGQFGWHRWSVSKAKVGNSLAVCIRFGLDNAPASKDMP